MPVAAGEGECEAECTNDEAAKQGDANEAGGARDGDVEDQVGDEVLARERLGEKVLREHDNSQDAHPGKTKERQPHEEAYQTKETRWSGGSGNIWGSTSLLLNAREGVAPAKA